MCRVQYFFRTNTSNFTTAIAHLDVDITTPKASWVDFCITVPSIPAGTRGYLEYNSITAVAKEKHCGTNINCISIPNGGKASA
mmetsp:Transcript_20009/g.32404  ORF Transcript_20009/g.32404 Transcript_20009/m.32404 type:complete len:83 (-) Transcript_20009:687-935(-)